MRHLIALTLLVLTVGCSKEHKSTLGVVGLSPTSATTVTPVNAPKTLLVFAGQSNGAELYDKGMDAVYAAMGNRDKGQLIPVSCAVGGSNIDSWVPGGVNYERCVTFVQQRGLPVEAIIFWQGEQEGWNGVNNWGMKFTNFANTFRQRVGAPNAPIVWARLGDVDPNAGYVYKDALRAEQEAVFVNNGSMVNIDGIPVGPDGTHYVNPGLSEAGRRFGAALRSLL